MYNKDCEICEGVGSYSIPNLYLEIMEKIDCMDCLLEEEHKIDLKKQLTRMLANTSPSKLAQIVAEVIVNSVDKNPSDDLARIEGIIHTKNVTSAVALASVYAGQ